MSRRESSTPAGSTFEAGVTAVVVAVTYSMAAQALVMTSVGDMDVRPRHGR